MHKRQHLSLFLLRVSMGCMFLYAGVTKIMDSTWSAAGYLQGAKLFPEFFNYLLQPGILPAVNLLNEWGLTLIGISLILGVFVRISALLGALLMVLYYLPLGFPMPNPHAYIVDEHVIYFLVFFVLYAFNAGKVWGLGNKIG